MRLEADLARAHAAVATTRPENVTATVEELIGAPERFPEVLAFGTNEERKAVVRAFLQEIRVEKATRQATLRWYRLPRSDVSLKLVEVRGLEPLTPKLPEIGARLWVFKVAPRPLAKVVLYTVHSG